MNRPEDKADEDEKKGESDRHEGAKPVEERYRRIITLAHLTMITMILEMQTKVNSLQYGFGSNQLRVYGFLWYDAPPKDRWPSFQTSSLALSSFWESAQKPGDRECCPNSSVRKRMMQNLLKSVT